MAEVTDEMITRALAVIMAPPGLQYFDDPASVAQNRGIIARALLAALRHDYAAGLADEDRIRDAMTEAQAHPGRTITR
jgi:hypothetical protein